MTALEHLHQLAIENNKTRFPLSWDGDRSLTYFKPKYSDKTEKGLKKCIEDFCLFNGWQAEPINNRGHRIDNRQIVTNVIGQMKTIGSVAWGYSSQRKGTADMSATIKGRSIKIEIKIGKDRQSADQLSYQKEIERAGGIYIIVRSFEDFYSWYNSFINELQNL